MSNKLLVFSFTIGLALAVGAGIFLSKELSAAEETIEIVVPNKYIPQYQYITSGDITTRAVSPGEVDNGVVVAPEAVIGKTTLEPLYQGEKIRQERITKEDVLKGYDFVCVNVDLARSGGAVPGNLVDVYSVIYDTSIANKQLIAKNAIVLNIWDGQGNDLFKSSGVSVAEAASRALTKGDVKPPAVIQLAVQPHETSNVVSGAVSGSSNIVLVVKSEGRLAGSENNEVIEEPTDQSEEPNDGGGETGADITDTPDN
ncbi:SAF domain-containing protein [Desulfofalx alkaliphila]|uniref:SAF domain-containing protein n=1 Tax=Desulfofalx alkaliphila TaxID=105483 RepID=UPI00146F94D0|nr:SAF domain-containing protein [Desulfofalx alkaliphila]